MKKKFLFKIYYTRLFLSLIFFFTFTITSCDSFFTGSKIKDELEKTIAYNQAPFAKIEVYSEGIATATLVPPAGNYDDKYKEGDLINLRFEPQENFNFVKWIASPDDSVLFDTPEELSTSAKILSSEYPISIHPVVVNKDILTVNYAYERGSVYSSASSKLFKGTEFQIRYNEDPDYAFIKWVVLDIDNKEVTDVLELNETELQTDVKILKTGTVVTLKAVVLERPSVVSATPVYSTNGVFRDNRIIVIFDKPIAPSSIYYSEEELRKLGIISSTETITETINSAEGWTLLKDSMRNNACYGYQKTDDDNLTVFKNIIISKRENSNVSLLKYFNPPYFESKDSSILRIDPKSNNDAPPGATDIIVTIKKDFGFYDNQKLITLPTNYKWTYYTNSNIDNLAPIFIDTGSLKFNVQFAEKDQENFITPDTGVHKFATETTDEFMENTSAVASNFIKNRLRTKKLWVSGQFEDGGSGPNYLKWELFKVNSYYYPVNTEEFIEKGQIDDIAIEGFKARITKKANIADDVSGTSIEFNSPLHEGLYRIDFIIADKNERTSKKSYYFVYDEEVQVNDESLKITNERKTVDKEKISWDIDELLDYSSVQIQQFFNGTEITEKNEHASEYSFSNMSQGRYTYKLWVKDIYGNISSEPIIWEDRIPPANITSHRAGVKYKKIYFYADAPNDADVAGIKFTKDNISESIAAKPYNRISKFYTYDTVNPDETTVVSVVAYDYAGNESVEPYVFVEHNGIAKGDICYKDETGNILFTKPENFINQYYDVEYNDYCAKEYLFFSMSYPLGYVCDVPEDYSKIRILEMISHDVSNRPWGKNANPVWNQTNSTDGLSNYNNFYTYYESNTFDNVNGLWSIWKYVDYYRADFKRTLEFEINWYIPALNELSTYVHQSSESHEIANSELVFSYHESYKNKQFYFFDENARGYLVKKAPSYLTNDGNIVTSSPDSNTAYYYCVDSESLYFSTVKSNKFKKEDYDVPNEKRTLRLMAQIDAR